MTALQVVSKEKRSVYFREKKFVICTCEISNPSARKKLALHTVEYDPVTKSQLASRNQI
jgi:hypothetical protein